MGEGFRDPIIGANFALIREAIRSRNYVPGVSGWSINRDGSAEFSDLTARGALDVGGIPGMWIGPRTHPDFPAALLAVNAIKAAIVYYTDANNYEYDALSNGGGSDWREVGVVNGGVRAVSYTLDDTNFMDSYHDAFLRGFWELDGAATLYIGLNADFEMESGSNYTIDGRSGPRGFMDGVRKADGATKYSGTAEAVVTDASVTFSAVNGRTYLIELVGMTRSSTAGDTSRMDIREDNIAGTQRNYGQATCAIAAGNYPIKVEDTWECTSSGSKTFVGTARRAAGGGTVTVVAANAAGQTTPLYMRATDITDTATMRS